MKEPCLRYASVSISYADGSDSHAQAVPSKCVKVANAFAKIVLELNLVSIVYS